MSYPRSCRGTDRRRRDVTDPHQQAPQGTSQAQEQTQIQRLRTLQASKQMFYDVYAHTMGMIEELEKHEGYPGMLENSGLLRHILPHWTEQDRMPVDEVMAKIETELTCLQAQRTFTQTEPEDKKIALEEMVSATKKWLAAREEVMGEALTIVDKYAANVILILQGMIMDLPERERKGAEEALKEETVNEVMYKFAVAQLKGEQQDKQFKEDPHKKATLHKMRQGRDEKLGELRFRRMMENPPEMR